MKYMILITLDYVLACLATWLIYSLLVYGFFTCNACQWWWTLRLYSEWYLLIILCISVLIYLWFSSCLTHECIPFSHQTLQPQKPFKKTLNPSFVDLIFEIVLACFFVACKQFLAQTSLAPLLGNEVDFFFLGILIISLVLGGELKPAHL